MRQESSEAGREVRTIRIGTRGSDLALAQAHEARDRLIAAHGDLQCEIVPIRTSGDRIIDRPLADIGGKGLFTQEIESRLLSREIDIAVHSSKDMPTILPDGLELACFLPRAAPGDCLIANTVSSLSELPRGARMGTSSLRRSALIRRLRPDLVVLPMRGNVPSRLSKLDAGETDALILAQAGLDRLGLGARIGQILPLEEFPPAPGQGAICVEARIGDADTGRLLAAIADEATGIALRCERAFLAALDGSCRTPIAAYASAQDGRVRLHGMILSPDGRRAHEGRVEGAAADAEALGRDLADRLRAEAGDSFFQDWGAS